MGEHREFIAMFEHMGMGVWSIDDQIADTANEVVRCGECIYKRMGWNGKRPAASDWFFCAYWGGHEITNPCGYCAWGERRVKGDA